MATSPDTPATAPTAPPPEVVPKASQVPDVLRSLSSAEIEVLAGRFLIESLTAVELSERYGVSIKQMRKFLDSSQFSDILDRKRREFESGASMAFTEFVYAGRKIAQRMTTRALATDDNVDPRIVHDAGKYVLDKLIPTRQIHQGNLNIEHSAGQLEAVSQLGGALTELTKVLGSGNVPAFHKFTRRGAESEPAELTVPATEPAASDNSAASPDPGDPATQKCVTVETPSVSAEAPRVGTPPAPSPDLS